SIANFRLTWLRDRLAVAYTAALVFTAAEGSESGRAVPDGTAREILSSIGAKAVAMKTGQQRRLLAVSGIPRQLHPYMEIRDVSAVRAIVDAFATMLVAKDDDLMRVVGAAPRNGEFIEIVIAQGPLRKAMWAFSRNVLLLSLIISVITAALVYFALHYL